MPMRGSTRPRAPAARGPRSAAARRSDRAGSDRSVMPSARVRLPGPRQNSRGAERAGRTARAAGPAAPHQRLAFERLERADQHRRRPAFGFGHGVDEVVDAVVQVDVRDPRRTVERRVARGRPGRRVARGIRFADVGLDLDDDAGRRRRRQSRARGPCRSDRARRRASGARRSRAGESHCWVFAILIRSIARAGRARDVPVAILRQRLERRRRAASPPMAPSTSATLPRIAAVGLLQVRDEQSARSTGPSSIR